MKRRSQDYLKMVIDWDRCIRVPLGEERLFAPSVPYKCKICASFGDYNGVLIFEGDKIPVCKDHGPFIPVRRK